MHLLGSAEVLPQLALLVRRGGQPFPRGVRGDGSPRGKKQGGLGGIVPPGLTQLTDSETRVLHYLPTHLTAPEIASELFLSVNTVSTHIRHLYAKLGVHSRHEAADRARALGLLAPSARRP